MPSENLEAVRKLALDLRQKEPRSPSEALGGFKKAARTLDKCRASLVGTVGEFQFNCPMDRQFFSASGLAAEDFRSMVATGASDEEVGNWIRENSRGSAE